MFSKSEVATYLFTAALPNTKTKSLTIIEWNELVKALTANSLTPENLLELSESRLGDLLVNCSKSQRENIINKISNRKQLGVSLIQLEDLSNQGYEVIFRSKMPARLKKLDLKLRPPFYYSAGDINILNSAYTLGVVGSRDAKKKEIEKIEEICKQAARHNIVVISGGAKGIDSAATSSVLKHGGKAVIFPSTGVGFVVKDKEMKKYIKNGQLLVLATVPTYTNFTGRYAMQRNKYIHSSSDAVIIGASQISNNKKSGTWEGVLENIVSKWSPMYTIGNSEGVLKLNNTKEAQEFISLEEIYNNDERHIETFESKLDMLIKEGLSFSLSKESIRNVLKNKISNMHDEEIEQLNAGKSESGIVNEDLSSIETRNSEAKSSKDSDTKTLGIKEQEQIKLKF